MVAGGIGTSGRKLNEILFFLSPRLTMTTALYLVHFFNGGSCLLRWTPCTSCKRSHRNFNHSRSWEKKLSSNSDGFNSCKEEDPCDRWWLGSSFWAMTCGQREALPFLRVAIYGQLFKDSLGWFWMWGLPLYCVKSIGRARIALIHGAKHFPVYTTYKIALLNPFLPSATLPLASL